MKDVLYSLVYEDNNPYIELFFSSVDVKINIDLEQHVKLLNERKLFTFHKDEYLNSTQVYPYYQYNQNKINLLEYLFNSRGMNVEFKDLNIYNLKSSNIVMKHPKENEVITMYPEAKFITTHINKKGKDAMMNKNPIWKLKENYFIMYCEPDVYTFLDDDSLSVIRKYNTTFFVCSNGYIAGRYNGKQYYIHQIIMNCYGNGKGTSTISVDHIDRNPLNNCMDNLRIVDYKAQQLNSKGVIKGTKRERKHNARPLPDGITQDMLKKYVVYYKECYNKEKNLYREFFKIEKHPNMKQVWSTSKSGKLTLMEKLKQANDMVEYINKHENVDISQILAIKSDEKCDTSKLKMSLPKYVSYQTIRNKPYLVFEKRIQNMETNKKQRICLKHAIHENAKANVNVNEKEKDYESTIQTELSNLNNKVKEKYNIKIL